MAIHDWSRVGAGIFHHIHNRWIGEIGDALNNEVLPAGYYALAEQIAGGLGPDVLTLEGGSTNGDSSTNGSSRVAIVAVKESPPKVSFTATTEMDEYVRKQNQLTIRHSSGDRIVAMIEIVSPGNKASRHALRSFVVKTGDALYQGYHLLIVDLHPPGPRDPQGIHGAIWAELSDDEYTAPTDKPLTLAAYSAGLVKRAYVQPIAVGDTLADMPLFLEPEEYVNVPLEATYQSAYRGVPQRWKRVLETPSS